MIYYLIFIYYILWLQNSNLILKSDLTALICFSDAEFSLIIYMMYIMSVKYFFGLEFAFLENDEIQFF